MIFYGTPEAIKKWREVITKIFYENQTCSDITVQSELSAEFSVDLSKLDRLYLDAYWWHRREDDAPRNAFGDRMRWNDRISFSE